MPEPKLSPAQFAARIKSKYPEYKDIADDALVGRIVEKYPEYAETIDFEVKKKEPSESISPKTELASDLEAGTSVSPETQPKKRVTTTAPDGKPVVVEWGPTEFKSSDEAGAPTFRIASLVGNVDATIDEASKKKISAATGLAVGVLNKFISPYSTVGETAQKAQKLVENTATAYNAGALSAQIKNNLGDQVPDLERVASLKKKLNEEQSKLASTKAFESGQSMDNFFSVMANDPVTYLTEVLTTSAVQQVGGLGDVGLEELGPAILLGVPTAGRGTAAYLSARNSLTAELSARTLDALEQRGFDTTDAEQLKQAMGNQELMKQIGEEIQAPAVFIAALDGVSAGVAGLLGKPIREAAAQMAAGAIGEAGAQLIEFGEIKAPAAIATEAIAELPGGLVEVAFGAKTKDIAKKAKINREIQEAEAQIESAKSPATKDALLVAINKLREEKNKIYTEFAEFANSLSEKDVATLNELNQKAVELTTAIEEVEGDGIKATLRDELNAVISEISALESKVTPREDAVQEQAAGEIPVQPEATVGEEVAQGEPQAEPEVAAEEVVVTGEEITPETGDISFGTAFALQDETAERTVSDKASWGNSGLIRERIENAGDILRELSSRGENPDPSYIQEKIDKLRSWIPNNARVPSNAIPGEIKTIDDFNKSSLRFSNVVDGFEYLMKFNSGVVDKIKSEYEAIPTYTKEQKLAKDSVLALLNQDINGLEKNLDSLQDVVDTINKEGKLEIVKSVEPSIGEKSVQVVPATTQELTEQDLPGFDRMMTELDGVIKKSEQRRASQAKIFENAMNYVVGSKAYESATDVQRESLVRMVNKMFGKREKSAPSVKRLFGEVKDIKNITASEYSLLKNQIQSAARGAREAKAAIANASKEVGASLKELVTKGQITLKQANALVGRFSRVNPLNEAAVERFVNYATKVFNDAEYNERMSALSKLAPTAKKNTQKKLGIADGVAQPLLRMFSLSPETIPNSVLPAYTELMQMMAQRKAVLNLEEIADVKQKVESVLDAVDLELGKIPELSERFLGYEDKVTGKEGKVDFAKTLEKMVKEGVIDNDEAAILRDNRSSVMPRAEKTPKSEQEISEEREVLMGLLKEAEVDFERLPTRDERELAKNLGKLVKTAAVEELDNTQLNNLLRVIENINNGYLPHYAELMVERLNAINDSATLTDAISAAKPLPISSVVGKVKSLFTGKSPIVEMIRRNPLFYIDQLFGNFKSKDIFNSVFGAVSKAQSRFESASNDIRNRLNKAEEAVFKSHNFDGNKTTMSKFKMMTYLRELEFLSNPGSKQVNPAAAYLQATIDQIGTGKSIYSERDAEMLQRIMNDYSQEGAIDMEKLYDSFNSAEKKAIEEIQKVNTELRDKAVYTSVVIRGDKIQPLDNYMHLNVLHEHRAEEQLIGDVFVNDYNNSLRPSTKAKSLIARTGQASPINFDVFSSTSRGANYVLIDYYLTEPVRTTRKMFSESAKTMKESQSPKSEREILNSVEAVFEESIDNLLSKNFTSTSLADEVGALVTRQGYRAILASAPRFVAELASNLGFAATVAPMDMMAGVKLRDVVLSADAAKIMNSVGSKQTARLYPHDSLSGRLIDTSIMNQAAGAKGSRAKGDVANKIQQIFNAFKIRKYANAVSVASDALISTPDKLVMRPLWFGSFVNEFKKQTGVEPDLNLIANNDEAYMAANEEAIKNATKIADEKSVFAGASDNAFMGILKGTAKTNQSQFVRYFNTFNNFMTRFLIYEYVTARTGIYAAMGNGSISRKQGVALLAGATSRMVMYSVMVPILNELMISFFAPEAEEEDDKTFIQRLSQGTISAISSLLLGRDFGNIVKVPISYGVERMNQEYLDFLRDGEYDPYEDSVMFSQIPVEKDGKKGVNIQDFLINMLGPVAPAVRTSILAIEKMTAPPKKEAEAIERAEKEKYLRVPLEVLGQAGLVPFYKDIRKVILAEMYKDLKKTEKSNDVFGKTSKKDLQLLYPELYNELYGQDGTMNEYDQIKKELEREKKLMLESAKYDGAR